MCFSMQADLVAGVAVLPLGALSLAKVREAREVPFAALPILFGVHQLVESLVWQDAAGHVPASVAHAAAVAYVVFALPVLPTLMPLAVLLLEPRGRRLRITPFLLLGLLVTGHLGWTLLRHGVTVDEQPMALVYGIGLDHAVLWTGGYLVAVMGAAVLSGYRSIVAFGVVNLVGLSIVALAYTEAFASLWCIWAAITSALVLLHMHRRRTHHLERHETAVVMA